MVWFSWKWICHWCIESFVSAKTNKKKKTNSKYHCLSFTRMEQNFIFAKGVRPHIGILEPWKLMLIHIWTASSEFGAYSLCEQRRFRRACASTQSRQNLRCSLIQAVSQEKPSDRKPDPWPFWMAGHAQLKFVMTECSKTQIRLTGHILHFYFDAGYEYLTPWRCSILWSRCSLRDFPSQRPSGLHNSWNHTYSG